MCYTLLMRWIQRWRYTLVAKARGGKLPYETDGDARRLA